MDQVINVTSIAVNAFIMVVGGLVVFIFNGIHGDLKEMSKSVQDLNMQIAKILANMQNHEFIINNHNVRLEKLEEKEGVQNGKN